MLSESTIRTELRKLCKLWKLHTKDREQYQFIRGAEFALAWALRGPKSGCKVSEQVRLKPEFDAALFAALNERTESPRKADAVREDVGGVTD
jgi:hypothetical protein